MENKHIGAIVFVLACIIVGMFVFAYIKKQELANNTAPTTQTVSEKRSDPYQGITRVDAKHFFVNGKHTVVGEIVFPTPCDLLNWTTKIQESKPETVSIDFDVVNKSESCAQTVTTQRFYVEFTADEKAVIKATLEGRQLELNLVPAGAGETPESYELFIKG